MAETRGGSGRWLGSAPTLLALVAIVGLLVRLRASNELLVNQAGTIDTLRAALAVTTIERKALTAALSRAAFPPGSFLSGIEARSAAAVDWAAPRDGVYWLLRHDCQVCRVYQPELRELSRRITLPSIVLGLDDDPRLVRSLGRDLPPSIPLIGGARGSLLHLAPVVGTPAAIVVVGGTIRGVYTGVPELRGIPLVIDSILAGRALGTN